MISRDTVMFALASHIGKASGVRARDLVTEICGRSSAAMERKLRSAIEELRLEGRPVVGHPSTGYYIAADAVELTDGTRFLRERAVKSLLQESRMLGMSIPDLIGQLRLPT